MLLAEKDAFGKAGATAVENAEVRTAGASAEQGDGRRVVIIQIISALCKH